jgi:ribonuclease P protein component
VRGWRRSGAAQHWLGAGKRDGSSSRSGSLINTPARRTLRTSLGFPRTARITRGAELQQVAREGKRIRAGHLDVRVVASPLARQDAKAIRIGLIVPRHKQSAVARNRLKRRIRELVRVNVLSTNLSTAIDLVIRTRPEAYEATFDVLAKDVDRMLSELLRWNAVMAARVPASRPTPEA